MDDGLIHLSQSPCITAIRAETDIPSLVVHALEDRFIIYALLP